MGEQPESVRVVEPLRNFLRGKGWHVEKFHGSQFQMGIPDLLAIHPQYSMRWIECKLMDNGGNISFTPAQEVKFPIWIAHGVGIWCIAGIDFRYSHPNGKMALERAYNKLFAPANMGFCLNPHLRKMYL